MGKPAIRVPSLRLIRSGNYDDIPQSKIPRKEICSAGRACSKYLRGRYREPMTRLALQVRYTSTTLRRSELALSTPTRPTATAPGFQFSGFRTFPTTRELEGLVTPADFEKQREYGAPLEAIGYLSRLSRPATWVVFNSPLLSLLGDAGHPPRRAHGAEFPRRCSLTVPRRSPNISTSRCFGGCKERFVTRKPIAYGLWTLLDAA
jgi:hypothetical protein